MRNLFPDRLRAWLGRDKSSIQPGPAKTRRHTSWLLRRDGIDLRTLAGTALGGLLGLGLLFTRFGEPASHLSYDLPFLLKPIWQPGDVVLVYLDEISHRDLGQPFNAPWDRNLYAQLLERLRGDRARLIVVDVVFSDRSSDPNADLRLARAIKAHGAVLLAADYTVTRQLGRHIPAGTCFPPVEPLRSAAAGWGLAQWPWDSDQAVRRHLPWSKDLPPSLARAAAMVLGGGLPGRPAAPVRDRWLNYYGPPGTFKSVSFNQALYPDGVPQGFFTNKVVFIGSRQSTDFTGKGKDEFATAYTRFSGTFAPGVELQATAFLNLVRKDWLERTPPMLEGLLLVAGAIGAGLGLSRFHRWGLVAAASGAMVLIAFLAWVLFHWQLTWFAWTIVEVEILFVLGWLVTADSIRAYVEKQTVELRASNLQLEKEKIEMQKKNLEESLVLHLSPSRVRQLMDQPQLLKPGTEKLEVSILFSDIAVFSKVSESLEPDDLVRLLNSYYETALDCIHATDGTVVKLIGDAIFAIWNAPLAQPDHPGRACRSALMLAEKLDNFGPRQGGMPFRTRVGLHTGLACVGNIGSSTRFDYTAIGESVNLASRLEGLNKQLGTQILASRDTMKHVGPTLVTRNLGFFRFKGSGRLVEVSEVVGDPQRGASSRPWIDVFEDALTRFRERRFDLAAKAFMETIETRSRLLAEQAVSPEFRVKDGPSLFYLNQIDRYRVRPPGPEWVGEIELDEK